MEVPLLPIWNLGKKLDNKEKTMKKLFLLLLGSSFAVQVKAASIDYWGVPSVLQDMVISSLTVQNQATFLSSITLVGASSPSGFLFSASTGSADSQSIFRIGNNGYVSIGTATPNRPFEVRMNPTTGNNHTASFLRHN